VRSKAQALFGYPLSGLVLAFLLRYLRRDAISEKPYWDLSLAFIPTLFLAYGLWRWLKGK